ncbi:MAG TPA: ATP-binding cassette domain-containing protein [Actinomycetes bacterium]|jgi:multiple sugar transport system ATP-binding protein|nr:ATP-binding cassette domain-containing protein [Actinomycetes bacterium]
MADVLLDDISRVYPDGTSAVSHLTLHVRHRELMVIVGPSGCGKSTALRLIAGLEPLSGGTISIGGRVVNKVPPGERDLAMVFEAGALYPHLTAAQNLRFGLDVRKLPEDEIEQRVGAESRVLRLGRFLDRKPRTLSAGQRQRVALGRATVRVPSVFLLDEPLTHLDAGERIRLRTELSQLQQGLGVTAIYVTHDQSQAMAIGNRVAVMRAGRIEQVAEPRELYRRPANVFVASFMGEPAMSLLAGSLEADAGRTWVVLGGQRLPLHGTPSGLLRGRVGPVTVGIRPEHVTDASTVPGTPVLFSTAARIERLGAQLLVSCPLATTAVTVADTPGVEKEPGGQAELIARFPRGHPVRRGDRVELAVDVGELSFFDPGTGEALWNPA